MDPLWIEVILAHIGMIWNVAHGVFSQCRLICETNDAFKQEVRAYDITINSRARGQNALFARALRFMPKIRRMSGLMAKLVCPRSLDIGQKLRVY